MNSRSHSSIRSQLTYLVVACVLPVWLVAGFLVFHAYSAKRNQISMNMLETAHAMTMVVDRELSSVQAALRALATSPAFVDGDFAALHRQTLELLKSYPGADIIVADVTGQQLVNSYRPYGDALPKRKNPEAVRSIFESGKPLVSDLFYGAVTRRPMIGIDVPVFRDGKVVYDLAMTFPSDRLSSILESLKLPKDCYGSILDSRRVLVTRTRNPERFVGVQATSSLRRDVANTSEGTTENSDLEGKPVYSTFSRSAVSNWTVVIGVPKATVMAELYQWMAWAIGGATAISLIGIILAMGIARRIAQDIQALVNPALSIGRGELVAAIDHLSVKETKEVAAALVQASELLQHRAKERDDAERQLTRTIDLLQTETTERLRATEVLLERERMLIQQSRHASMGEMIGNIAHQWRQPLNTLGLIVQELPIIQELGMMTSEKLDSNVAKAKKVIFHMSQTIDDFRNFFRPDKQKVSFKVNDILAKTVSLVDGSFSEHQIKIEISAHEDISIHGYPNEYSQVILNILNNARDAYAERKADEPRVVLINLFRGDDRAVLTITDNAGGIAEEILAKIFDPYFSTKGPDKGTGVGLFISKNIIEKNMDGSLSVCNSGKGAEFRIEI